MKKTLINLLILTVITLLAAIIYKNLNYENSEAHIQIKKQDIVNSHPTAKPNKKFEFKESTDLSSLANEQKKISIDIALANDTTNALFIKGRLERSAELVRLADLYTNNALLQYLASVYCVNLDENPCDAKRFAQRILNINPNSAIGKELLVTESLLQNDYETAISGLETINTTDEYNIQFKEVFNIISSSLEQKTELEKYSLSDIKKNLGLPKDFDLSNFSDKKLQKLNVNANAFGIAFAQPINGKVFNSCLKQIKSNPQKERWIKACNTYGLAMQNSTNTLNQGMGLTLNARMQELLGNTSEYEKLSIRKDRLNQLLKTSGQIIMKDGYMLGDDLTLYIEDLTIHGEIEAMLRLIERQKAN